MYNETDDFEDLEAAAHHLDRMIHVITRKDDVDLHVIYVTHNLAQVILAMLAAQRTILANNFHPEEFFDDELWEFMPDRFDDVEWPNDNGEAWDLLTDAEIKCAYQGWCDTHWNAPVLETHSVTPDELFGLPFPGGINAHV
ncbi:hypothetical protein [Aggregatilinea lenta]|uniref:hypothetical protein n=1 Tax=Aggregatilinea lenta TaxID=913108 RepID=UPI000E5C46E0|nr:hypothetical protein [Aggregatilinea lenta]